MMVRTRFPGGSINAEQYLLCDDLSSRYGQNDMRATSRQTFLVTDYRQLPRVATGFAM